MQGDLGLPGTRAPSKLIYIYTHGALLYIAMGENMIQGTRMTRTLQYISVKNKGFLAGDRLKKRIFYSPSRKFRREVCFGTYCKFLNYPLPAISFESNFYSIIKFLLVLLMKYRFMIKKSVPRSKYFSTKIIRNGEEIPSVM